MSRDPSCNSTEERLDDPEMDPLPSLTLRDTAAICTHADASPAPSIDAPIPGSRHSTDDPRWNGHTIKDDYLMPDAMQNARSGRDLCASQRGMETSPPNGVHYASNGANDSGIPQHGHPEPLAIVGMAFEFPDGAVSDDSFWDMMTGKRCASSEFPADRINIDAFNSLDEDSNLIHTRKAHFLRDDIYNFDASFFSISPADAAAMDPCQRRLMETTYHALENAGMTLPSVSSSNTSVHVGCFSNDYMTFAFRDAQRIPKYAATGASQAILANRISWFFNLRGPSMTVDTACSSGLVALDLACQGLWNGTTDMAIVAGANLILSPEFNISLSNMNFLSKDGRCFSFDHRADGYARGEGFVVLVVKRLREALNDNVRAVIRSVGTNQDGRTDGGITQPSGSMQTQLIRETYRRANLDMTKTRFFEAHGTGTSLGDPTEANAIGECFGRYRTIESPLYVGAVKSNIGHLEGTSGLAGVVKAVLALEKGTIPPNTNFEVLNPDIDADLFHLDFPQACVPWPRCDIRRASVNSFGFGGANAHVVLDDAELYTRLRGSRKMQTISLAGTMNDEPFKPSLLIFSAAHEAGIEHQAKIHSQYLQDRHRSSLSKFLCDYTWTLAMRRTRLLWTSFCVLESPTQMQDLGKIMSTPTAISGLQQNLGLVFTGQGAQWLGMGRELLVDATFKGSISRLQKELVNFGCTWSLIDHLEHRVTVPVDEAQFSQVLTTALQIALVDLVYMLGVNPSVVVGHSSGEIAAAYAAGHISSAAAIKISYYRGWLGSRLEASPGERHGMVAVGLSHKQMEAELENWTMDSGISHSDHKIAISCINSPSSVTVSGIDGQLNDLLSRLHDRQIFARKLKVKLAYHSRQMAQISDEYMDILGALEPGTPKEKAPVMVSSVTGDLVSRDTTCKAEYWTRNMVSAVNFLGAIEACNRLSHNAPTVKRLDRSHKAELRTSGWLELGPHSALQGPMREILSSLSRDKEVVYTAALIRNKSAFASFLSAAGRLHCHGFSINLEKVMNLGFSAEDIDCRSLSSDAPSYPFNHSIQHREEAPLQKHFRLRSHGKHNLLGSPLGDPNPHESQWSFIIKEDEMPWVRDHKVNGAILYPAAGMLVMAIEAVKQVLDTAPLAFELEDVNFLAPIMIPSGNDSLEVRTHLSSAPRGGKREVGYRFRIFLFKPEKEPEMVCTGKLRGDFGFVSSDVDHGKEQVQASNRIRWEYEKLIHECSHVLAHSQMYQSLRDTTGLDYGPEFQPLHDVKVDKKGHAVGLLAPHDLSHPLRHTVHPTRLDGIFQMCFAAMTGEDGLSTFIPSHVRRMWISASGLGHPNASQKGEKVYAKAKSVGRRLAFFDITAVDGLDMSLKVEITGLELTAVSSNVESRKTLADARHLCSYMIWKVDLDTLGNHEVQAFCDEARGTCVASTQWWNDLAEIVFQFGLKAFKQIQQGTSGSLVPSMERYMVWLGQQIASRASPSEITPEALHDLCARVLPSSRAEAHIRVGRQLPAILRGEVDPLALIFADDGKMTDFYLESIKDSSSLGSLGRYLECLTHKRPNLRFLEIGAGTGSMTTEILNLVGAQETGALFQDYVFTDISPSFLDKAREVFKSYTNTTYRILDIEEDPFNQGFEEESHDVVITDNVLHATRDLVSTLRNVRRLLKPGGKLIFKELTTPRRLLTGFMFGLLPGWWKACEDERRLSPTVTETRWSDLLRQAGFSGTDLVFPDHHVEECHQWSFLVATAIDASTRTPEISEILSRPPLFVLDTESAAQLALAHAVTAELDLSGPMILSLEDAAVLAAEKPHSCSFIFLYEADNTFVKEMQSYDFPFLTKLLQFGQFILWVKQGGGGNSLSTPDFGLSDGLCRVNRFENSNVPLVVVALERIDISRSAQTIAKVYTSTMRSVANGSFDFEPEYSEVNDHLHISRLTEARHLNEHIYKRVAHPIVHETLDSKKLKLGIRAPGLLDTLEWSEATTFEERISPDAIEVAVKAIGINFKDCLTLLGRTKSEDLGSEYSGIVRTVGTSVTEFRVGDRVALGALNSLKTCLQVHRNNAVRIPESMSFVEAAAIPTAYCTAYYTLVEVARLHKGETILIHAAAGGTGQAAVQIAQYIGAEVFATVGSHAKKKLLMDRYAIPEDHILYSRDTSFALGIKRMTNGTGVDVILNNTSGRLLEATWTCIASFGRFVEIGLRDIISGGQLPMDVFARGVSFSSVDLSLVVKRKDHTTKRVIAEVFKLFEKGELTIQHPLHVYPLDEAEEAFRFLQSGKSSGKLVLEAKPDVVLPVVQGTHSHFSLDANATYVVAGGLGGLGRSIARWLVGRGAKNLILLSRTSINARPKAKELLADLAASGANVQCPPCDITDLASLQSLLMDYAKSMPVIKGCIQAAMVLQDATISSMTIEEWNNVVKPKVEGSWNLHVALPSQMDFFVLLSSCCGIFGNGGQANYAAANTYLDALAKYRATLGENAVSLDLGYVLDEGFVAENRRIMDRLSRLELLRPNSLEEVFAMLDYYCQPSMQVPAPHSQVVTGLRLPTDIIANGKDVPAVMQSPLFRHMHRARYSSKPAATPASQLTTSLSQFVQADSAAEAILVVSEALKEKLSRVLGVKLEQIRLDHSLSSYGVDSLVGLELRNWLARETGADLPVFELLSAATLKDIGDAVVSKSPRRPERWKEYIRLEPDSSSYN